MSTISMMIQLVDDVDEDKLFAITREAKKSIESIGIDSVQTVTVESPDKGSKAGLASLAVAGKLLVSIASSALFRSLVKWLKDWSQWRAGRKFIFEYEADGRRFKVEVPVGLNTEELNKLLDPIIERFRALEVTESRA